MPCLDSLKAPRGLHEDASRNQVHLRRHPNAPYYMLRAEFKALEVTVAAVWAVDFGQDLRDCRKQPLTTMCTIRAVQCAQL